MASSHSQIVVPVREKTGPLPRENPAVGRVVSYLEVLKPLPSILLAFIGLCAAFIAGEGQLSYRLLLVLATVLIASAGADGLTNYLDRDIDARMQRTS